MAGMIAQTSRSLGFTALLAWSACALAGGPSAQMLEQHLEADERKRIHHELDDYSSKAYPDREQMEERRQKMRDRLKQVDMDDNGVITREEAEQRMPGLAQRFDEVDTDSDGSVDYAEIMAAEKMREMREQQARRELDRKAAPAKKHLKRRKPAPPPDVEAEGA
jgi:hypothetical protein